MNRFTGYTGQAQLKYDSLGHLSAINWGSSGTTSSATYGYDPIDRLSSLSHDLGGTSSDQTLGFTYSPSSQISSRSSSNDSYAYAGSADVNRNYTANGLNQYTTAGTATFTYDTNGNLTSDGSNTFVYDAENKLTSVSGAHSATLSYDPLGRLWQIVAGSATTRFIYDGNHEVVETDGSGNQKAVFVWGPGADEPLVMWQTGAEALHADNQGSIISIADSSGNVVSTNAYDEYGTPGSANQGRFQFTGQAWLSEVGLYYYKARFYSPTLGRFLQTDPVGVNGGINLHNYTGNDPVNAVDPTGLAPVISCVDDADGSLVCTITDEPDITVTGSRCSAFATCFSDPGSQLIQRPGVNWTPQAVGGAGSPPPSEPPIIVTGHRTHGCGEESGGNTAKYAGYISDFLGTAAVASAIVGLEPLAAALEGGSLLASAVKARAQWTSGDHTGSIITGVSAVVGSTASRAAKAVGGEAITLIEERVQATGQGAVGYIMEDVTSRSGQATFCKSGS